MNSTDPAERMIIHLTGKRSHELPKRNRSLKFPVKLMYALECGSYDDIMGWAPSGLAFVIMDPVNFEKKVLPELFKEAKFASFDRKIKRWGFVKSKNNRVTKSCCYGHPNFQRGDYNRCMMLSCLNNQQMTPALFPSNNTINRTSTNSISSIAGGGGFSTSSTSFEDVMGSMACLRTADNPMHTARLTNNTAMGSMHSLRTDDPIHIARLTNNTAHQQQQYNSPALLSSFPSFRGRNINGDMSDLAGPMIGLTGTRRRSSHQYVNEQPCTERKLAYYEKQLLQQQQHQELTRKQTAAEAAFFSLRSGGATSGTGIQHLLNYNQSDEYEQKLLEVRRIDRILREALLALETDHSSGPGGGGGGLYSPHQNEI